MMTNTPTTYLPMLDQRWLWWHVAVIGFITGGVAMLSLLFDTRLGFHQTYFEEASHQAANRLLDLDTQADYTLMALAVPFVFLLRLFLAVLLIRLLQIALIPPSFTITAAVHQLAVMGGVAGAMIICLGYVQVLFYSTDANRSGFVLLIKNGNLLFLLMIQLGHWVLLSAIYRTGSLPRWVVGLSTLILVVAFLYSIIAVHPNFTQFFSVFIAYIAMMIVVSYMGLIAQVNKLHDTV